MENAKMKTLNMKLALSALAIAMLATPALAKTHQQVSAKQLQDYSGTGVVQQDQVPQYPDGGLRSGTANSYQSGAEFNLRTN
jgi:hypothetical protein